MNAHQLDANGVVVNTIVVDALTDLPNLIDASHGGTIGDIYTNGKFTSPGPTPEQVRAAFKAARTAAVASIVVDVNGLPFDGDETSQTRMARAIVALQAAGQTETTWVLANNVPTEITLAQLQMALIKAGTEQTRLWMGA